MKLEKSLVKYNKEGEYEYTISSEYFDFENEKQAIEYVKNNIEKDVEYYFFDTEEDVGISNHYNTILCNELKKTLAVNCYKINATIFIYDEFGEQEDFFTIYFDGLEFDDREELEDYIKEEIENHIELSKIDADSLEDVIHHIIITQCHRIGE